MCTSTGGNSAQGNGRHGAVTECMEYEGNSSVRVIKRFIYIAGPCQLRDVMMLELGIWSYGIQLH